MQGFVVLAPRFPFQVSLPQLFPLQFLLSLTLLTGLYDDSELDSVVVDGKEVLWRCPPWTVCTESPTFPESLTPISQPRPVVVYPVSGAMGKDLWEPWNWGTWVEPVELQASLTLGFLGEHLPTMGVLCRGPLEVSGAASWPLWLKEPLCSSCRCLFSLQKVSFLEEKSGHLLLAACLLRSWSSL